VNLFAYSDVFLSAPAVYAQVVAMKQCFDQLTEAGVYSEVNTGLLTMTHVWIMNDDSCWLLLLVGIPCPLCGQIR
jgi:hypothetical protein